MRERRYFCVKPKRKKKKTNKRNKFLLSSFLLLFSPPLFPFFSLSLSLSLSSLSLSLSLPPSLPLSLPLSLSLSLSLIYYSGSSFTAALTPTTSTTIVEMSWTSDETAAPGTRPLGPPLA